MKPVNRPLLRKSLAYGLWGGTFAGLTLLTVNAVRFSQVPGFVGWTVTLGLGSALIFGSLGYLFFAGILLKDE